jgi:hypothetical protein
MCHLVADSDAAPQEHTSDMNVIGDVRCLEARERDPEVPGEDLHSHRGLLLLNPGERPEAVQNLADWRLAAPDP